MPNFFLSHKRAKVAARMARQPLRHDRPHAADLRQGAPRSGPRTAEFGDEASAQDKERKAPGVGRCRSYGAMKLFTGWVMSAGLVFTAAAANAQVLAPYQTGRPAYAVVSDVGGPYAATP